MILTEIYKNLERYKINFENLFIDNIFGENKNSFLTKTGKKFILTGKKIVDSIRNKYLTLNIANPENKYMHERVIRKKIRNILKQKRGKTLFISALLNIVPIGEIEQQMKAEHPQPTILNYTGDKFVLKREADIENKKHIIIQFPNWRIKIESRDSRPNLPYSDKNVVKIGYNRANKNGVIKFTSLFYSHSYFSTRKSKETTITLKNIAINNNKIGIFIHVRTYRYNRHFGSNSADYNVGFYFDVLDNKIILSKTKRPKNFEEFLNILKKEGNKNEQRKNTNKDNELQRSSNRIMEGSKDKKAVQVCNRKTA